MYFFTLENNGRVYFDEVGPPWPKHPCTDRRDDAGLASSDVSGLIGRDQQAQSWEKGWVLLTQVSVEAAERSTLRLSASLSGEGFVAFVLDDVFGDIESPAMFLQESYIQTRPGLNGQFELALLTPELRAMLVIGYLTAAYAASSRRP